MSETWCGRGWLTGGALELTNPAVARWVLEKLSPMRALAHDVSADVGWDDARWTPEVLSALLEVNDPRLQELLLDEVPVAQWSALGWERLVEARWEAPGLVGVSWLDLGRLLAQVDPAKAMELFDAALEPSEEEGATLTPQRLAACAGLAQVTPARLEAEAVTPEGVARARRLLELSQALEQEDLAELAFVKEATRCAWRHRLDAEVERTLKSGLQPGGPLTLHMLADVLVGERVIWLLRDPEVWYDAPLNRGGLEVLLRPEAPTDALLKWPDADTGVALLREVGDAHPAAPLAQKLLGEVSKRERRELVWFVWDILFEHWAAEALACEEASAEALIWLLRAGVNGERWDLAPLLERLGQLPLEAVRAAREALPPTVSMAEVWALNTLGDLSLTREVLQEADPDEVSYYDPEMIAAAFLPIVEQVDAELLPWAVALEEDEAAESEAELADVLWSALGLLGGEPTVDHLIGRFEAMRARKIEDWCVRVADLPDERLIALLEPELRRAHPEVDHVFVLNCDLFGVAHPELSAVRARMQARSARVEEIERGERRELSLDVECQACGDWNRLVVPRVFLNPEHRDAPATLAAEHACPSCGASGLELVPVGRGMVAIMGEMLRISRMMDQPNAPHRVESPLRMIPVTLADGTVTTPPRAVEALLKEVEANPDDARALGRLGLCLDDLGQTEESLELLRDVARRDPSYIEAVMVAFNALQKRGEHGEAFELLERSRALVGSWRLLRLNPARERALRRAFVEQYNEAREEAGRLEHEPLGESFYGDVRPTKKISRNAPCPCGSGKKYKKCCLSRHA